MKYSKQKSSSLSLAVGNIGRLLHIANPPACLCHYARKCQTFQLWMLCALIFQTRHAPCVDLISAQTLFPKLIYKSEAEIQGTHKNCLSNAHTGHTHGTHTHTLTHTHVIMENSVITVCLTQHTSIPTLQSFLLTFTVISPNNSKKSKCSIISYSKSTETAVVLFIHE